MTMKRKLVQRASLLAFVASLAAGCASGPLSTREKAAGVGALGGAATGAIIGSTVGRAGSGAAIGGALGLGAGALVGDKLQSQEQRIERTEAELARERRRRSELVQEQGEY